MIYTVRYCHLESIPKHKIGDTVKMGNTVGTMGNSGFSKGAHLHIDVVEGEHTSIYNLYNLEMENPKPSARELNYFIDKDLFCCQPVITSYYNDYRYLSRFKKMHPAYDVIPSAHKNLSIFWNRSYNGKVLKVGFDSGYGFHIYIKYKKG